jgi:hypothetical protein
MPPVCSEVFVARGLPPEGAQPLAPRLLLRRYLASEETHQLGSSPRRSSLPSGPCLRDHLSGGVRSPLRQPTAAFTSLPAPDYELKVCLPRLPAEAGHHVGFAPARRLCHPRSRRSSRRATTCRFQSPTICSLPPLRLHGASGTLTIGQPLYPRRRLKALRRSHTWLLISDSAGHRSL